MIQKVVCPQGHEFPARFDDDTAEIVCPTCQATFPVPRRRLEASGLDGLSPRARAEVERGVFCFAAAYGAWLASLVISVLLLAADFVAGQGVLWFLVGSLIAANWISGAAQLIGASLFWAAGRATRTRWILMVLMLVDAGLLLSLGLLPLNKELARTGGAAISVAFTLGTLGYLVTMAALWRGSKVLAFEDAVDEGKRLLRGMLAWLIVPPILIGLFLAALVAAGTMIVGTAGLALVIMIVAGAVYLPGLIRGLQAIGQRFLDPSVFARHFALMTELRYAIGQDGDPAAAIEAAREPAGGLKKVFQIASALWGSRPLPKDAPGWMIRLASHGTVRQTIFVRSATLGITTLMAAIVAYGVSYWSTGGSGLAQIAGDQSGNPAAAATPAAPVYIPLPREQKGFTHQKLYMKTSDPKLLEHVGGLGALTGHRRVFLMYCNTTTEPSYRMHRLLENDRHYSVFKGITLVEVAGNEYTLKDLKAVGLEIPSGADVVLFEISPEGKFTGMMTDSTQWPEAERDLPSALERFFKSS